MRLRPLLLEPFPADEQVFKAEVWRRRGAQRVQDHVREEVRAKPINNAERRIGGVRRVERTAVLLQRLRRASDKLAVPRQTLAMHLAHCCVGCRAGMRRDRGRDLRSWSMARADPNVSAAARDQRTSPGGSHPPTPAARGCPAARTLRCTRPAAGRGRGRATPCPSNSSCVSARAVEDRRTPSLCAAKGAGAATASGRRPARRPPCESRGGSVSP